MSILTVRQLTAQIKDAVENGFPYVWVRGEVTNVSRPSSGHIYFSLKDENALLQAVWFKGSQKERETFDPLTGEVFEDGPRLSLAGTLRNGQQVICAGRLTVYAPRGGYQLVVELAQDSGEGQLHLALEALKRKLAEKGYFSLERKRPIPEHPPRVAVITAPSGAAIRDFLRLSGERGTGCEIRIHPVPVQGDDAPPLLAEAIGQANAEAWADLIVLIRGGGSLQDLWAFNDERVARAIADSHIPVISAVGLIRGIGVCAGLTPVEVEGATGLYDTNYEGKAEAALRALRDEDFVFLHIEASDEAGHEGDAELKVRTIEALDARVVRPIFEAVSAWECPVSLAILPDHPTPCLLRTHTAAPVPFTIWRSGCHPDMVGAYDEQSARRGRYGHLRCDAFIDLFIHGSE